MADKRMFAKTIISSDAFLDMSAEARALYYHLSMFADDDGFVNSPRSLMRSASATENDLNILINNKFIIYFKEEGIAVIKHWNISNTIRNDVYKETKYKALKDKLILDDNGSYTLKSCNETVTEPLQDRNEDVTDPLQNRSLDQISIDQDRSDQDKEEPENDSPKSTKKIGLLEREPKNDLERVNKTWLENYITIFGNQPINPRWDLSSPLVSKALKQAGIEKVLGALEAARNDKFCLDSGYILKVIMSGNVLSRLINVRTGGTGPPSSQISVDKKSLKGLEE
jgi:hypothetical protein